MLLPEAGCRMPSSRVRRSLTGACWVWLADLFVFHSLKGKKMSLAGISKAFWNETVYPYDVPDVTSPTEHVQYCAHKCLTTFFEFDDCYAFNADFKQQTCTFMSSEVSLTDITSDPDFTFFSLIGGAL